MSNRSHLVDRAFKVAMRAFELVLAIAFIVALLLNFINVIGRYLYGYTYLGADEVQIYIMVWMAFAGAAIVTWRDQHLRMDVVLRCFPAAVQEWITLLTLVVFLVMSVFVVAESTAYTSRLFAIGQTSDMAGIPMWLPHSAILIGFAMMGVMTIAAIVKLAGSMFASIRKGGAAS